MLPNEASAKSQAFTVFEAVPRETVRAVRDRIAHGELHGHSFESCFLGLFAQEEGHFIGLRPPDREYATELQSRVVEFAASVGVPILRPGTVENPIEIFVLRIDSGDKPEEHPALEILLSWFDEWLEKEEEVTAEESSHEEVLVTA